MRQKMAWRRHTAEKRNGLKRRKAVEIRRGL